MLTHGAATDFSDVCIGSANEAGVEFFDDEICFGFLRAVAFGGMDLQDLSNLIRCGRRSEAPTESAREVPWHFRIAWEPIRTANWVGIVAELIAHSCQKA